MPGSITSEDIKNTVLMLRKAEKEDVKPDTIAISQYAYDRFKALKDVPTHVVYGKPTPPMWFYLTLIAVLYVGFGIYFTWIM